MGRFFAHLIFEGIIGPSIRGMGALFFRLFGAKVDRNSLWVALVGLVAWVALIFGIVVLLGSWLD